MKGFRLACESIRCLGANKRRTFLMAAGTMVGMATLTITMAVGRGTHEKVMERVTTFGYAAIMLIAGGGKDVLPPDMSVTTLTLEDAETIRQQVTGLQSVTPMAWFFPMNARHEANQHPAMVWGVEPNPYHALTWYTAQGDDISVQDASAMAPVCIIGRTIKEKLFPVTDPIGQRISVNKVSLLIKGVLEEPSGGLIGIDFDNLIIVPITAAMRKIMNVDYLGAIRLITKDPRLIEKQAEKIRALICERHHLNPPQNADFRIITPMIIAELVRGQTRTLSLLLIGVTLLSFLGGGVVLRNNLLISVAGRTKEISLRRTLGATRQDIFNQFLFEALTATFFGMLAGSFLGLFACLLLSRITSLPLIISWEPFLLGLGSSLILGMVFGAQAARKAAKASPPKSLQWEV